LDILEKFFAECAPDWRVFFENEKESLRDVFSSQYETVNHSAQSSSLALAEVAERDGALAVSRNLIEGSFDKERSRDVAVRKAAHSGAGRSLYDVNQAEVKA
jgi:hypothetical protein